MQFLWLAPDDRGSPILSYNVKIKDSNGDFILNPDYCSNFLATSCSIPMRLLNSVDGLYTLPLNSLVTAVVAVTNALGEGEYS